MVAVSIVIRDPAMYAIHATKVAKAIAAANMKVFPDFFVFGKLLPTEFPSADAKFSAPPIGKSRTLDIG